MKSLNKDVFGMQIFCVRICSSDNISVRPQINFWGLKREIIKDFERNLKYFATNVLQNKNESNLFS